MPDRRTGEERHRHRLIRRVVAVRGEMRFRVEVQPRFNYGRDQHEVAAARARRRLPLAEPLPRAPGDDADRLRRARACTASSLCARASRSPSSSSGSSPTTSRASTPRPRLGRRTSGRSPSGAAGSRRHATGALARDGAPLGAHAEAPHLPARPAPSSPRRRRACPSRSAAGGTGTTATRGSATPPSPSTRCCASASPTRRRRSWTGSRDRFRRRHGRGDGPAPDHVRDRRPQRADRGDARPLRGLPRLAAGADRQRRRRPAPARHLRRADRLRLPLQQVRPADLARRLGGALARSSTGSATTGTSPTRGSGRCAAAGRTSPTRG